MVIGEVQTLTKLWHAIHPVIQLRVELGDDALVPSRSIPTSLNPRLGGGVEVAKGDGVQVDDLEVGVEVYRCVRERALRLNKLDIGVGGFPVFVIAFDGVLGVDAKRDEGSVRLLSAKKVWLTHRDE